MSTETLTEIKARVLCVRGNDIDTDQIMPARFLKELTFDNLGDHVFADETAINLAHPFALANRAPAILVANENFGCGSSREHAPQGLKRWGISAIIAESFAEIFYANCLAIGLPCLIVSDSAEIEEIQKMQEQDPTAVMKINLKAQTICFSDRDYSFEIDAGSLNALTSGQWNMLQKLLQNEAKIRELAEKS